MRGGPSATCGAVTPLHFIDGIGPPYGPSPGYRRAQDDILRGAADDSSNASSASMFVLDSFACSIAYNCRAYFLICNHPPIVLPVVERCPWIVFGLSALIAIVMFFIPAFIIRPFAHQSAAGLGLAMHLRQRAPWGTLIACFLLSCVRVELVARVKSLAQDRAGWGHASGRIFDCHGSPELFRVDVSSHREPEFESAAASKLGGSEMILTVRFGEDARAYPIREMAYHHILNDVVAGVPVAVTY